MSQPFEKAPMYTRHNPNVVFVLPALAFSIDVDGRYFIEVAWLCWALGLGDTPT